ncbi:hypothetical protein [Kitasatospora sp. NPDC004289]
MKIRKQVASIGAAVAVVLGGSMGAWALSNASPRTPITNQQGTAASASTTLEPSTTPSTSPSAPQPSSSPTATPTTPTTEASSASSAPTPTKASTVSTPTTPTTPAEPTHTQDPTNTDPATAGQYNGGHGTADNGPYPSRGPADPNAPTGPPNKEANTPPSASPSPSPSPSAQD